MTNTVSTRTTYEANCHCGAIKYSVTLPRPLQAFPSDGISGNNIVKCNCSICTSNGYIMVYPLREDVLFHCGEESMARYLCATKSAPHRFCPKCGSALLVDTAGLDFEALRGRTAINIRMFQGIEDILDQLMYRSVEGKKMDPPYKV